MNDKNVLRDMSLSGTVDELRKETVEFSQYVDDVLSRVDAVEPELRSLVPEEDRHRRVEGAASRIKDERRGQKPPLYGVPVGIKDIFHVDGLPTKAGSNVPAETLGDDQGTVIDRLQKAGSVLLGKTVTAEFAYFEPGPTRNPHNVDYSPGGSSSGSAAAVAAGLCPLAIGTQTIGSITRPAAFCGIVGMKPSYGRIPADGLISCSESVDHVGFFTQDVAGAHLAAGVMYDDWQLIPKSEKKPTLAVPSGPYLKQADERGLRHFRRSVSTLEASGYQIKRVELFSDIEKINQQHKRLMAAEFALVHHDWYGEYPEGYSETSVELIGRGRSVPTEDIAIGRASVGEVRDHIHRVMDSEDIDLWITPAAPGPAPEGITTTGDPIMNLPWTHAGLPTIALPASKTDNNLPIGVQVVASFNSDEDMLGWSEGLVEQLK